MSGELETSIRVENEGQLTASAPHSLRRKPSDLTKQWKGVIHATVFAKRLQSNINELEPKPEDAIDSPHSLDSHVSLGAPSFPPVISNGEGPAESTAQTNDQRIDPESLKYLRVVHAALVQQLNSYGLVLTLLAAVTSVAILQPPGSFDKGHMVPDNLVACFLWFSSVSFLLACTGLMAVIVGSAALFRPWFFPELPPESQLTQAGFGDRIVYDDIVTLGDIIEDNVLRVRRLRVYLALSLGFCMVAFVCGAFAILGPEKRYLYMAIGTILGGGGVVLVVEIGFTLAGPTRPPRWLRKCARFLWKVGSGRIDPAAIHTNTLTRIGQAKSTRLVPSGASTLRH